MNKFLDVEIGGRVYPCKLTLGAERKLYGKYGSRGGLFEAISDPKTTLDAQLDFAEAVINGGVKARLLEGDDSCREISREDIESLATDDDIAFMLGKFFELEDLAARIEVLVKENPKNVAGEGPTATSGSSPTEASSG